MQRLLSDLLNPRTRLVALRWAIANLVGFELLQFCQVAASIPPATVEQINITGQLLEKCRLQRGVGIGQFNPYATDGMWEGYTVPADANAAPFDEQGAPFDGQSAPASHAITGSGTTGTQYVDPKTGQVVTVPPGGKIEFGEQEGTTITGDPTKTPTPPPGMQQEPTETKSSILLPLALIAALLLGTGALKAKRR